MVAGHLATVEHREQADDSHVAEWRKWDTTLRLIMSECMEVHDVKLRTVAEMQLRMSGYPHHWTWEWGAFDLDSCRPQMEELRMCVAFLAVCVERAGIAIPDAVERRLIAWEQDANEESVREVARALQDAELVGDPTPGVFMCHWGSSLRGPV